MLVWPFLNTDRMPDITKRSGLKKIYHNFDDIYNRIDDLFSAHPGNQIIRGGVVAIYAKMSADSILRNLLFQKSVSLILAAIEHALDHFIKVFWPRSSRSSKRTALAMSL